MNRAAAVPYLEKSAERPRDQDYRFLRERCLAMLRELGGDHWTDHNLHDPGVTLAEMLCYVLTDLGLRTGSAIEDILAERHPLDSGDEKLFFTARESLASHPVTLDDFRKLLLDVPGIRNGWLEPVDDLEPALYLDCKAGVLSHEANERPVRLQGIYDVLLDLEPDPDLGDMGLWRYGFQVDADARREEAILRFAPVWDKFLAAGKRPEEFTRAYLSDLESKVDTPYYSGRLILDNPGETPMEIPFLLQSPFPKDRKHEDLLEKALRLPRLSEIVEFVASRVRKGIAMAEKALARLHADRSLCEDFRRVKAVELEEVGVCADIEIRADAEVERVAADIEYALSVFLSPRLCFYSFEELREAGIAAEDIFSGPSLKHGFLREEDLAASRLPESVHASDILGVIMAVNGVVAVRDLMLSQFSEGLPLSQGRKWGLKVGKGRSVRFTAEGSKFVYYKGLIPYSVKRGRVRDRLRELAARERHVRLAEGDHDAPVPRGSHKGLADYGTLQRHFPMVYGIGDEGLPDSATPRRKAQAKQLKAYLLVFEQVLADHLAQLGRVKDLFSLDSKLRKTYFSRPMEPLPATYQVTGAALERLRDRLTPAARDALSAMTDLPARSVREFEAALAASPVGAELVRLKGDILDACEIPGSDGAGVPRLHGLLRPFVESLGAGLDADDFAAVEPRWRTYLLQRKHEWVDSFLEREDLLEDRAVFEDRRNRFLDHLLARFGEQFSDYVLLSTELEGPKSPETLIEDKLDFLRDLPEVGYARGKAFDYRAAGPAWGSRNVSGLERRVARLVGMARTDRRALAGCGRDEFVVYQERDNDGVDGWRFRLPGPADRELLSGTDRYSTRELAYAAVEKVLRSGRDESNYEARQDLRRRWYFVLKDADGDILARVQSFMTRKAMDDALAAAITRVKAIHDSCEGFHLVEHILLRPAREGDARFTLCSECGCGRSPGESDPYSFRVTAMVPAWPRRFADMDFRRFFEETLRREAPAHVHVKVCWASRKDMEDFENAYSPWLERMAANPPQDKDLAKARRRLIAAMEKVRSVYPDARLHDCEAEGGGKVLLNMSRLGTAKEGDHDD